MIRALTLMVVVGLTGCATLPETKHKAYHFPKEEAFVGNVKRTYQTLGMVRSKVNYESLMDPNHEDDELCKNYYNKAVTELIKTAKAKGGDAVIDIKSVVFLEDGRQEFYPTPECSDDGQEGQILTQGVAVRWNKVKPPLKAKLPPLKVKKTNS